MARTTEISSEQEARIEDAVVEYLSEKKHWKRNEYRLEYKGITEDKRFALVWAIYLKDETNPRPGSGQSVALYLDPAERRIVKESRWQ